MIAISDKADFQSPKKERKHEKKAKNIKIKVKKEKLKEIDETKVKKQLEIYGKETINNL
jgi:hypothetical protein